MPTSTARTCPATQGDLSNYRNLLDEPDDHAIGRYRGGLTTRIHALVDGTMRPLVMLLGPGQGGDSPMFENLMDALKVDRVGPGRPRTRPDRAMADKAYSSKAIRAYLRGRGIECVIPEKDDQKANRKRKGSAGGRPVTYDKDAYKRRNVVERSFNTLKAMALPGHPLRQTGTHLPLGGRPARRRHLEHPIRRHTLVLQPRLLSVVSAF